MVTLELGCVALVNVALVNVPLVNVSLAWVLACCVVSFVLVPDVVAAAKATSVVTRDVYLSFFECKYK